MANEVLLLPQVSCRGGPPLKDPVVSSRVVDCDSAVLDERRCSRYGRLIKPGNQ